MSQYDAGGGTRLVIEEGDLTKVALDAIVNAANERMLGGGGVDGAIHRAAGAGLVAACREVPEVSPGVRCPTGEARITAGFELPARHVIHTVGPVYVDAVRSAPPLRAAHRASLELAARHHLASIAFPAISCGVFGYPIEEAAPIAVAAAHEQAGTLEEVRFVLFGREAYDAWCRAADTRLGAAQ